MQVFLQRIFPRWYIYRQYFLNATIKYIYQDGMILLIIITWMVTTQLFFHRNTNQSMSQNKTYTSFDTQRCLNNIFHFIIEFQSIKIDFIMSAYVTSGNELLLQIYWKFI